MKRLTDKFNESLSFGLGHTTSINEAYAEYKDYGNMLKELFDKYEKKKNAKPKKSRFGYLMISKTGPSEVLTKYPVQILIDKAGFEPKQISKWVGPGGKKEVLDKEHYGNFIVKQIEDGKISKEDMIKWWKEYDEQVAKNNWHDPKYIVKQLDATRLWNPYYPKDDSVVRDLMENPAKLARYIMPKRLTSEEREEFRAFLSDPANQESLKTALKGIKGSINKARPSFATGSVNHIKSLVDNCDYNGGDISELIKKEYESNHKSYYSGANDRDCEASAVIGLILKAINELYGFEVWSSFDKKTTGDEYEDRWAEIEHNVRVKGQVEDKTLEGFLDDADSLQFTIKKLKRSDKKRDSGVYASSFSSYYDYDFDVIVTKNKEEIYHKEFTNITVGSYFYSGGWD